MPICSDMSFEFFCGLFVEDVRMFPQQLFHTHITDSFDLDEVRISSLIDHCDDGVVYCQICGTYISRNESSTVGTLHFLTNNAVNASVAVCMAAREDDGDFGVAVVVLQTYTTVHYLNYNRSYIQPAEELKRRIYYFDKFYLCQEQASKWQCERVPSTRGRRIWGLSYVSR